MSHTPGTDDPAPAVESGADSFHPSFQPGAETDIVLCSGDGVSFCVRSQSLRSASGWFNTMFSLPQGSGGAAVADSDANEPIRMHEGADVVAGLLNSAFSTEMPPLHSIDLLEGILNAAEKYDMPGVVLLVRALLLSPLLAAHASPVRIYGIAYERGWFQEASYASSQTLTRDIFSPNTADDLARLDGKAITKLLSLHRSRRIALRDQLNDTTLYYSGSPVSPPSCTRCGKADIRVNNWQAFKYACLSRPELDPITVDVLEEPEFAAALNATCPYCFNPLCDTANTRGKLRQIFAGLLNQVEFP